MSKTKIIYEDLAVGAAENAAMTSNNKQSFSDLRLLNSQPVYKNYANPCELNQAALDESQIAMPQSPIVGMWSLSLSGANGIFSTQPVVTATLDGLFSSIGITLGFDSENNLFSNDLTIEWWRGSTKLSTRDFQPNHVDFFCQNNVEKYNKVVITFKKMCMPFAYLKLHKLDFGKIRVFMPDEIVKVQMHEEISLISEEISVNTMSFTLVSNDNYEFIFQKKQKFKVYFADILKGCFFIDTAKRLSESTYDLKTFDYIGILDKMSFNGGIYTAKNAFDLAKEIMGNVPFDMAESLKSKTVTGWLPISSARNAMLQLAFAIGAVVDTSQSDKVLIYELDNAVKRVFGADDVSIGESFDDEDKATEIQISEHNYVQSAEVQELYKGDAGNNIPLTFTAPMHSLVIANGVILQSGANYAIINANTGCVLTGKAYKDNQRIIRIANPVILANDLQNIVKFEQSTLISKSNSQEIAQKVYDHYVSLTYTNARVKMDAEKVGDTVEITTSYKGAQKGVIVSTNYALNSNSIVAEVVVKNDN